MASLLNYYSLSVTSAAAAIIVATVLFRWARGPNLPPGPRGWPVVGNLFQVARSGRPFFELVNDLRKEHGPIFTLKMGTRTLIVLSGANLVREALSERGADFASRPRENPTRNIFSANKFTVNAAVYGPVWRSLRRNMVHNVLSSAKLREFSEIRSRAMDHLVKKIRDEFDDGGFVSVLKNARFAVFVILVTMCFGLELDEETVDEIGQVMKEILITLNPRIDDYLPILSPFFAKQRKKALEVRKRQMDILKPLINRRRKALESPGSDPIATSFSYLDTLFDLRVDSDKSSPRPTEEELVTLCSEFLNGGTDTTATAIEWGIARLISDPTVQNALRDEVFDTVGPTRRPIGESDVSGEKMPYLEAFVKELLRKHPPTPLSLTHAATKSTTLGGYDIPADANLEIFFPGILEDPKLWDKPDRFDPTRFLGKPGQGWSNDPRMVSFGVGRRICPGLSMATVHIHLMIARMVQEFEWSAYPPGGDLDFSGKSEFTVVMKNPLRALIKPRV